MNVAEPERLISREEVVATMFMVAELPPRSMSSDDFSRRPMKRKRSKKEIAEQAQREAENRPSIRRVRELAKRAQAELEARRRRDAASNP